jgi:uncharacterized protein (DUF2141 family)
MVAVTALAVAAAPAGSHGYGPSADSGLEAPTQDDAAAQGRGGGRGGRGQTRDNVNQPIGTGTIRGAVYADGSGTPVRRAQVRLTGAELGGGRFATTNDQGVFEFVALPAGRYSLTASKASYVSSAFGARSAGRPGTPIQLAEGQTIEKAFIALARGGVITGIVVDDNGEPSPGTQVRVMRFVMRSGERSVQQAGLDTTDDRGMYRIYGLQPGEYLVSAIPRNQNLGDLQQAVMSEVEALLAQAGAAGGGRGGRAGGLAGLGAAGTGGGAQVLIERAAELQQQLQVQEEQQSVAYAPVYYPGTASPSGATSVTIGPAEERPGVDFQLQLVATADVDGLVTTLAGELPPGTQVFLAPVDLGGLPNLPGLRANSSRVNQDGRFSFQDVTPGRYMLQARSTVREVDPDAEPAPQGRGGRGGRGGFGGRGGPIAQVLWAAMDLSIAGTDLSGLVLNLQPGMTVSGQVQFDGAAERPADLTRLRVNLTPRGQQAFEVGGVPPAEVDDIGRFTVRGVAPGHYSVQANVGGPGRGGRGGGGGGGSGPWALASARVGGVEALDFPFEVPPGQDVTGAQLIFTDRTQQLSGVLQDASGRPTADYTIVAFPADERYWVSQSRRIAAARPDTDGRFSFDTLPPGQYRLTAITDAEPGEWYNPAFLTQLVGSSMTFSLAEGEKRVQDIRLAGGGH